ncbi:MAG: hypothetical protein LBG60_06065, partial [Bifidobacteriaceae bacterium]|nr:hypothetical protein [Bifidobacteriaceae bacterium]
MSQPVPMPPLGESVTEGTVTQWLKKVGDAVAVDEPLVEISTDKVDTEIPSPFAGVLLEILVPEDEVAEVGAVLALLGDPSELAASAGSPYSAPDAVQPPPGPVPVPGGQPYSAPDAVQPPPGPVPDSLWPAPPSDSALGDSAYTPIYAALRAPAQSPAPSSRLAFDAPEPPSRPTPAPTAAAPQAPVPRPPAAQPWAPAAAPSGPSAAGPVPAGAPAASGNSGQPSAAGPVPAGAPAASG